MPVSTDKRPGRHLPALPKKPVNSVPRSSVERLWLIGGGTVALLLTVIAYFFFISPQRSETDSVRSEVSDAGARNALLQQKLNQLRQQNQDLSRYQAEEQAARKALPSSTDVSDFIRSLQSLGGSTGTNVISVTVGNPVPFTASPVGGAAAPSASASSPAASASPSAAPRTSGVYGMAISAQVTGSAANLTRFIDQLQNVQPRAVLVTSITETTGTTTTTGSTAAPGSGVTTLAIGMTAFVASAAPAPAVSTGTAK